MWRNDGVGLKESGIEIWRWLSAYISGLLQMIKYIFFESTAHLVQVRIGLGTLLYTGEKVKSTFYKFITVLDLLIWMDRNDFKHCKASLGYLLHKDLLKWFKVLN